MIFIHIGLVVLMLFFPATTARTRKEALERACKAQITAKLPQWTMASVTPDVAQWAESQHENLTLIYGDFDGDGRLDIALLIQDRPTAVFGQPARHDASHVAICLSRPPGVVLHLIDEPYCSDFIERARKGQRYYDFEAEETGTYLLDGVRTVCYEKASATYVYDGKSFRQIVDGD